MIPIRQSTAFEVAVGPVLDATGVAVTDCIVGDFKIKKATGNFAALNGSATLAHVSAGIYDLVLTTSDTDTVGLGTIAIDDTVNACPLVYLQVIEEAVYDAFYAASATGALPVSSGGIASTAFAAGAIDAAAIANAAIDAATFAADVDAEILSYIVDDATRIDASALNTAAVTTIPAIVVDTNELQTDWTNGGRLDLILDDVLATIDTIALATNADDLASKVADDGAIISSSGSVISGTYTDTASDDNTYWITAPVTPAVAGFGLRQNLRFDLDLGRVPTQLELKGYWNGSGQTAEVYALNARTGVYDKLTNTGTNLLSRSSEFTYAITIPRDYSDDSGGVNNIVTIEVRSTSTNTAHRMRIDRALLYHVSEAATFTITTPTAEQIWTYVNRTLTTPGEEPSAAPTAAENAAAVLAVAYEGAETFEEFLRLARAALVGKASGLNTNTPKYRDAADTKDRIDATTDVYGNRTAVTTDAT